MLRRWSICFNTLRVNYSIASNSFGTAEEDTTQQYSLTQSQIEDVVKSNPTLQNVPLNTWQQMHSLFSDYGFKTKNFIEVIAGNPKLLNRPRTKIQESLEFWRGFQFGESRVENLILRYPTLLDILSDRKIQSKINILRSFVNTTKNVWVIIMNSPNVLQDEVTTIEAKFNYLHDVMRLDVSEIVKSEAFSFTLDEIKTRHVFLERLGLFKPRSPKAPPGEISKNPRLHQIMESSESRFATKVALVTLAEFEVFKELYQRELERSSDSEHSESDDE